MLSRITAWFGIAFVGSFIPWQPLAAQPKGDDWPTFRGNSLQTGVADSPVPEVLAVRWSVNTKTNIESSPIIYAQTVFFAGGNGKLYALDLATGKQKWEYLTAGTQATPAARDGAIYIGDAKGKFHCVDAATGKQRWIVATDGQISAPANFAKDKILFGSEDHHLYCVNTAGKTLWQCETKEKIRGAPAIVGDRVLLGGCDQLLHIVDLNKGKELGTVSLEGHVAASVAVHGDFAYVGNMASQVLTIDWKKQDLLWQFVIPPRAQAYYSSPAVTEDLLVVGGRDKVVHAWHRKTGKEAWKFTTKGRVDSSPAIAGKRVIIGSLDGNLYLLDLARGAELARFDFGPMACAPAVGAGCVVVTTIAGDVICLGAQKVVR